MRWTLWLCVVALGCGDSAPPAPEEDGPARSGSRLKLRWYEWDDGTRQWERHQFFDSERGEWCYPLPWDDGETYCTPKVEYGVFADPSCTTKLVRADLTDYAPYVAYVDFRRRYEGAPDVIVRSVHEPGEPVAAPAMVYRMQDGRCDGSALIGGAFLAAGREVLRSELVALSESAPDPAQRLSLVYRTSLDGLQVPHALHDTMLDLDCAPGRQPDAATARCEPFDVVPTDQFSDAECTRALVPTWGTTPASLGVIASSLSCLTFYPRGTQVTPTTAYRRDFNGACYRVEPIVADNLFDSGPELPLAIAPREIQDVPGRRLQRILFAGLDDTLLHDSEMGIDCVRPPSDTTVVCVSPDNTWVQTKFTDSTCTTTLEFAYVKTEACRPAPPVVLANGWSYDVLGPPPEMFEYYPDFPLQRCRLFVPLPMDGHELRLLSRRMPLPAPMTGRIVDPQ